MQTTLSEFVRRYPVRSFKKNETLIFQDDKPLHVYYIKTGYVKGYDIDSQGTEQLLWLGTSGDFCPLLCMFEAEAAIPYFLSALTDVEAYAIRCGDLRSFLEGNYEALREVSNSLMVRLVHTFHHLNAVEKARAEEKIIYSLNFLIRRFGTNQSTGKVTLPLTHQDIASLIGLSRETATQELKKLKERGYIHYDKYSFVIHADKLQAMI
ncbi:MAG TPA: Crp/Fnr family transcriptional regulator [Candidatus Saccharimonadales bacterium]|nr:Crp/Fnr family transcriptional regulator [Candidatus Saccharimonadales bacterium]